MASLNDIIRNINHTDDNTKKGSMFEKLCLYFLMHDKIYAPKFSGIWLWSQWPGNNGMPDTGIDIVAKFTEGESYCAVQCKFRQNDSAIPKAEIDSFMSLSSKSIYSQRILFALTDDFNDKAKDTLTDQNPPVKVLTLQDLANSSINWEEFSFENLSHVKYKVKALLPHQVTAVNDVLNGLAHHDRGKLIMACGTGKTFTSLKIAEKYAGRGGNILVLVPSISLLNQSITSWNYDHDENLPLISLPVCSDSTAGYDEEDLKPQDLTMTPTTDADTLIDQWQNAKGKNYSMCVIFSTYQSLNVIHDAQAKGFPVFDLVICDEAHRTAGITQNNKSESRFRIIHDDAIIHAHKRLYMTATPRIFGDTPKRKAALKKKAEENDAVLYSMDDEKIYGPEFHTLSFKKAVNEKLLADYKVIIFMVEKLSIDDPDLPAKIEGVYKALAKDISPEDFDFIQGDAMPMKRAVAFSNTIKASEDFTKDFTHNDNPITCRVEHIDGTLSARKRSVSLQWLASEPDNNECRILSNARCLSEGVDVPALDAVIFLNPRSSQIDIVQSIGRVMRKSEGKKYGYVILPVIVSKEESPEKALDKNESYQTVWKVLQALRAHDERFIDVVNSIDLREKVRITSGNAKDNSFLDDILTEKYRQAIYIRMVKKCGGGYWETWIKDFVDAFNEISDRINQSAKNPNIESRLESFTEELKEIISPSITRKQAVEMLAQHITSKEIFDSIFAGFSGLNPISQSMQKIRIYIESQGTDLDPKGLENFDEHIRIESAKATTGAKKQDLLRDIYNSFFKEAFKETAEKLGIVYTPNQIVDFILRSADWAARHELGISDGLSAHDLHILDPFSGTGTFTARLIQLGLISSANLGYKYQNEIHANELLLLAYYISAVNIEAAFSEAINDATYIPFKGIILSDTFRLNRDRIPPLMGKDKIPLFYEDGRRAYDEETTPMQVIIGNPPYNVEGKIAEYESIDKKIADTYAKESDATNKGSLYDSYIRAIKWASERVNDTGGIVCYVTNASFIDGSAMDGMRKELAKDFTSIYIFNLRGNANTSGDIRRNEAGNVFGDGTKCPIAITLFVRDIKRVKADGSHDCKIWYYECADGMKQSAKLKELEERISFGDMMREGIMTRIRPDEYYSWINQMSDAYKEFLNLGRKREGRREIRGDIFSNKYSMGVKTNRDAWCYNFSEEELRRNITRLNAEALTEDSVRIGLYRPYVKEFMHFSRETNQRVFQMPQIFPKHDTKNLVICVSGVASKYFSVLMTDHIPGHDTLGKTQCFPLYWYEETKSPILGTSEKRYDGIDDPHTLVYRVYYNEPTITNRDVFYYIYGVLSSREYAARFGNDTKKALARVPFVKDIKTFWEFANAGYELGRLHVNYESVDEWPVTYEGDRSCVRIQKMRIVTRESVRDSANESARNSANESARDIANESARDNANESVRDSANESVRDAMYDDTRDDVRDYERVIRVNDSLVISGIPSEAWRYVVNGRSALEWIVERYCDSTDKASGIRNDCNMWGIEHGNESYVLNLIARVVRLSVESVRIIEGMPEFGL